MSELDRGTPAIEIPAAVYTLGSVLLASLLLARPLQWTLEPGGAAVVICLGVVTIGAGNLLALQGMQRLAPGPTATLMLRNHS
ncbi:MAG: hypothetical protein KJN63_02185 [Acidimicrobiia bacterium]|nr:hypothetical protein [Acidimicrobiia bacterium]